MAKPKITWISFIDFRPDLILIKSILVYIDKKILFPKLFQHSINDVNLWLTNILAIYQNIIKIYNNKNVEIFEKDLVNITLKTS